MRHLVYRVQALPESLLPLVWDFGQLDNTTETLYVRQMVRRWVSISILVIVMPSVYDVINRLWCKRASSN